MTNYTIFRIRKLCIGILCLLILPGLYGLNRTRAELGFTFEPELNRTFRTGVDFSSFGSFTVYNRLTMSGGLSLGVIGKIFDIKTFTKAEVALPLRVPLSLSLHYIYNGLSAYKTHIQSFLPMVSLNGRWAGIAVGTAWHFTVFNREAVIVEPVLAFSGYVNFYNTEKGRIGLQYANTTDFMSGNMGAYALKLYSLLEITKTSSFINELTLYQTGSVGLAAHFYGLAYRGGILFKW